MIARVAWLLARPGTSGFATLILPATTFAIVTALLLTVLGGAQSFWTWTDDIAFTYQLLAVVALVLLVVPLASLGGAAGSLKTSAGSSSTAGPGRPPVAAAKAMSK